MSFDKLSYRGCGTGYKPAPAKDILQQTVGAHLRVRPPICVET
jgi:hypothetical protein